MERVIGLSDTELSKWVDSHSYTEIKIVSRYLRDAHTELSYEVKDHVDLREMADSLGVLLFYPDIREEWEITEKINNCQRYRDLVDRISELLDSKQSRCKHSWEIITYWGYGEPNLYECKLCGYRKTGL